MLEPSHSNSPQLINDLSHRLGAVIYCTNVNQTREGQQLPLPKEAQLLICPVLGVASPLLPSELGTSVKGVVPDLAASHHAQIPSLQSLPQLCQGGDARRHLKPDCPPRAPQFE